MERLRRLIRCHCVVEPHVLRQEVDQAQHQPLTAFSKDARVAEPRLQQLLARTIVPVIDSGEGLRRVFMHCHRANRHVDRSLAPLL